MNQIHVLLSVKENEKIFRIDDLSLWKMVESHLSQVKILHTPQLKDPCIIHQNTTLFIKTY
jgi:hypothetical protein